MERTDFFIHQRPIYISLECPHCYFTVRIPWEDLDVPKYWGDDWGEVKCPYCKKMIQLGDYDI